MSRFAVVRDPGTGIWYSVNATLDGEDVVTPSGGSADVATDPIWDAKGDLVAATGADAAARLPVGGNGDVLTADSGETLGVKWAPPAVDGVTSIAKSGGTPLTGDVTLSEGANVTLTQVGQDIEISASGSGSGTSPTDTHAWMPLTTVVGGVPDLVWDGDDSLIPTYVPI